MNLQKVLQNVADNRAKVCAKEYYIYRLLGTGGLSFNLFIFQVRNALNPVLKRDGRKGSLAKFGFREDMVCFANVPWSDGMISLSVRIILDFIK